VCRGLFRKGKGGGLGDLRIVGRPVCAEREVVSMLSAGGCIGEDSFGFKSTESVTGLLLV